MVRLHAWLADLVLDLRHGVRTLLRSPVFTVVAVGTLAIGIGANTAVFSLVDTLIFRDLPVRDPARLVQFAWTYPGDPPLNIFSVDASIVPERLIATVSGSFAGMGLLLAALGMFGLLAYSVARRTREIGVRMALGATERDVALMVLRAALTLVSGGLLLGAPLALWSTRVAATMFEDLPGMPVLPVAAAAAATIALSLVAAYVPARRASRVDPVIALRAE